MKVVKASVNKCPFRVYGSWCCISKNNKNCPAGGHVSTDKLRIPCWCPLKKGPVTVELEQEKG